MSYTKIQKQRAILICKNALYQIYRNRFIKDIEFEKKLINKQNFITTLFSRNPFNIFNKNFVRKQYSLQFHKENRDEIRERILSTSRPFLHYPSFSGWGYVLSAKRIMKLAKLSDNGYIRIEGEDADALFDFLEIDDERKKILDNIPEELLLCYPESLDFWEALQNEKHF